MVSQTVLLDSCPICGQSPLAGDGKRYTCNSCKSVVVKTRWLGLFPRNRFTLRSLGPDYRNAEADLLGRSFTLSALAGLANTCYTDTDLKAIANGELTRIHPPTSTVAGLIFEHAQESCYAQLNGLKRAQGDSLPDGASRVDRPLNKHTVTVLDEGNLFISNQRLVFPSDTHTTIRIDRKLTGFRAFSDAFAVQRKGEEKATYFLDCESRQVALVEAFMRGRLEHLR